MKSVATRLKTLYGVAKKVASHNGTLIEVDRRAASRVSRKVGFPVTNQSFLIYFKESPRYCVKDKSTGVRGTLGRECNTENMNTCNQLCDKCGYSTHMYREDVTDNKCKCRFEWCCKVICEPCETKVMKAKCVKREGS